MGGPESATPGVRHFILALLRYSQREGYHK